ncbi:MAG: UDP-N-acetylglucosamine 2-epimerase (non-hydrolyzing) [bacterium]
MKHILTVVGARPQFIKAAIVSRAMASQGRLRETMVHTGQHYDDTLSRVFFEDLQIPPPAHNLGVGSGPHGQQTARMLEGLERILLEDRPDSLLVYGDTNSTLAGALAAAKLNVPIGHVEAGLRSFNRRMPEEINRVVCDHLSSSLFAPTQAAAENLAREGLPRERIHLTGDVMYDASLYFAARAEQGSSVLGTLGLRPREYVLTTIHRAENTDQALRLAAIIEALCAFGREFPIVFPLHPRTRDRLERGQLLSRVHARLRAVEPAGYLDMLVLEKNARLIVTDSGGVQKEAYFYRVPCLTLRDETEWVELVAAGWNRCVSPLLGAGKICEAMREACVSFRPPPWSDSLYGNGRASQIIADILAQEGPSS